MQGALVPWVELLIFNVARRLGANKIVSLRVPGGALYCRKGLFVCMPGHVCRAFRLAHDRCSAAHDVRSFINL